MIKKALLLAGILFLSYSIFVIWFAPKWWAASQHQWQDNTIKAQEFLYAKDTFANVIVGSSLSARLLTDSLPQTYNLSFSGQSIFDGLNILDHCDNLPKNVFIEMNVILRPENKDFTSSLNSPLYYPRKVLPSLRDNKQPIAITGSVIKKVVYRIKNHFPVNGNTPKGDDLFLKLLQLQIDDYSKLPDEPLLNQAFKNLKEYVNKLEQKHIKVTFFEMPVNSQLLNLPKANVIRNTFYKNFPESKYSYIPLPDSLKFTTTDGLHLTPEEAARYTSYLKNEIKNTNR